MQYTKEIIEKKKNKIEKERKIFSIFICIIVLPIIFYNILLIIMSIVKSDETPSFFGIKNYVIISGSMQPNYNIGDIVLIQKTKEENIKVGDVISFKQGQSVVTHRVIEIKENENEKKYITKGDFNNVPDSEPVKFNDIEGICIKKIPYLGNIVLFLKNKVVIISIIIIFGLIYLHDLKVSEKERIRRIKRKKFELNMLR